MKVARKIKLLSVLLVATLFVQNADATLLPYSSHYQGLSYFDSAGVTGQVDFAVYDTLGPHGNEWTGAGFAPPGAGRYIYAYQIFNDTGSADAIEFFSIMGIDDHPPTPIPHHLTDLATMGAQDPWEDYPLIAEGVAPTDTDFSIDETNATWKFAGGILVAGEYSWFLIFSSAYDWVEGRYEMTTAGGLPISGNPEPGSVVLFGIGGVLTFIRTRKKFRET
jgi:hypothetical protein